MTAGLSSGQWPKARSDLTARSSKHCTRGRCPGNWLCVSAGTCAAKLANGLHDARLSADALQATQAGSGKRYAHAAHARGLHVAPQGSRPGLGETRRGAAMQSGSRWGINVVTTCVTRRKAPAHQNGGCNTSSYAEKSARCANPECPLKLVSVDRRRAQAAAGAGRRVGADPSRPAC